MKHYDILNSKPSDSIKDIKKRYRELCRTYHPDKCSNDPELVKINTARIKLLTEAWSIIGDPVKRKQYDEVGDDGIDEKLNELVQAKSQFIELFIGVVCTKETLQNHETTDILNIVLEKLDGSDTLGIDKIKDAKEHLSAIKRVYSRLKVKDKRGKFIHDVFKSKIDQQTDFIKGIEHQLKINHLIRDIVAYFDYEVDDQMDGWYAFENTMREKKVTLKFLTTGE